MTSVRILGVRVDDVTLDGAAEAVLARIRVAREGPAREPRQEATSERAARRLWVLTTPNPEMIMTARVRPDFAAILDQADLAVPDGVGLLWAARRQGTPLRERVAGCDLLGHILERGAGEKLRVFFLGAAPGVAEEAARRCRETYPGLEIAGTHHGYFGASEDRQVAGRVARSGAEFVAVGMGSPRQERWVQAARAALEGPESRVAVAMPVGGSLDVLSGRLKRAPDWASRLGLEWLVRLLSQPARWRRAPTLVRFVRAVLRERT